jgi:hypothetical protein
MRRHASSRYKRPRVNISKSPRKENHRSKSPRKKIAAHEEDAQNIITQARVNRSRYEWDEGNYEDKETEMGASCFTHRVHKT